VLALERRVLHQHALDFLVELDGGELQQLDRLLQLRREREVLREAELQGRLHDASWETLHPEVFAKIHPANVVIVNDLLGMPGGEHRTFVDDVGAIADAERLANVMVCDEHTDAALLEEAEAALD